MAGFTLLEAIMVIVITGVLGALVASFAKPLQGYFDAARRADLTDVADTALRRMARELQSALPNSIRVSGGYVEFLPTVTGGRYRAEQDCSGACTGDVLDFTGTDTGFDVIGALATVPSAGQVVVVYNLGLDGANAYNSDNTAVVAAGTTATRVNFDGKQFPFESPGHLFQIIGSPVTLACVGTTLWRYSGYTRQATQPTDLSAAPLSAASSKARLATGVDCSASSFVYVSGVTQRDDLVSMRLKVSNASETVTLHHQAHVFNVP